LVLEEACMGKQIVIRAGIVEQKAELNDSPTAEKIWDALPIEADANSWGDEIYFAIPVTTELSEPMEVVEKGDLGYWDQGRAFCIFFGLTPVSSGDEIRPASAVDVVGRLLGEPEEFKQVDGGERVTIEKAEG
jgi:hypothetical protein